MSTLRDGRPSILIVEEAIFDHDLTPYEIAVYLAILKHVNHKQGNAWPGMKRLATLCKMSTRQVMRAVQTLEDKKLIAVERDEFPDKNETRQMQSNRYTILSAQAGNSDSQSLPSDSQSLGVVTHSHSNHMNKEPDKTPPTPSKRTPRTKSHSRAASPGSSPIRMKPYDDIAYGVRFGIINAWCSNLRAQPVGAFKSDANHETAADLTRAGYSEREVERFVQAKRGDPWWDGKTPTLQKVAELLPEWLAANRPKPKFKDEDLFLSEEELNAIRPDGTEYLVSYVQ